MRTTVWEYALRKLVRYFVKLQVCISWSRTYMLNVGNLKHRNAGFLSCVQTIFLNLVRLAKSVAVGSMN